MAGKRYGLHPMWIIVTTIFAAPLLQIAGTVALSTKYGLSETQSAQLYLLAAGCTYSIVAAWLMQRSWSRKRYWRTYSDCIWELADHYQMASNNCEESTETIDTQSSSTSSEPVTV